MFCNNAQCGINCVLINKPVRDKNSESVVKTSFTMTALTGALPGLRVGAGHRGRRERGEGGGTGVPGAESRAGGRVDTLHRPTWSRGQRRGTRSNYLRVEGNKFLNCGV